MRGMAEQIPLQNDPEQTAAALAKVRADKEREVAAGHDGMWVAHPALVPLALESFARIGGPISTTDAEGDMLDLAPGLTATSRLSCQAVPDGSCDLVVEVPGWNRNLAKETHH